MYGAKAKTTERLNAVGINFDEFKNFCFYIIQKPENMDTLKRLFQMSHQKTIESEHETVGKEPVFNPPEEAVSKKVLKALQQEHEEKLRRHNQIIQRNYYRDIKDSQIASLEGFMIYLEIDEDHEKIFQDIIRHQNRKLLPGRILIQRKVKNFSGLTR